MAMTVAMAGEMARQTKIPTNGLHTYLRIVHFKMHTHFLWKEGSGEMGERIQLSRQINTDLIRQIFHLNTAP